MFLNKSFSLAWFWTSVLEFEFPWPRCIIILAPVIIYSFTTFPKFHCSMLCGLRQWGSFWTEGLLTWDTGSCLPLAAGRGLQTHPDPTADTEIGLHGVWVITCTSIGTRKTLSGKSKEKTTATAGEHRNEAPQLWLLKLPKPPPPEFKNQYPCQWPHFSPTYEGQWNCPQRKKKQKTNTIDLGRGYTLVPRKKYAYSVWTLLLLTLVLLGPF